MQSRSRPVVLSADDDENAHVLLKHAFSKAGVTAVLIQVNDGDEVLQYLLGEGPFSDRRSFPLPDLLLLDLKMPRVSGFGVLEHLSEKPMARQFPVIVFSCSDAVQDVKAAYQLGCHSYVMKPTSMEKLIDFASAIERQFFNRPNNPSAAETKPDFSRFVLTAKFTSPHKPPGTAFPADDHRLKDSPEMFQLLVEQVKDYAIFALDPEGTILSWNEGARRIKGYEAAEVVGKHFSIFYSRHDRDNDKPAFELRMAQEMGRYEEEGWRLRKDGSRFWANVVLTPLRDKSGKLKGYAKVTRDLTQRKIQEDSLQRLLESEERFRLLVDQVKDYAIFILDAKGNIASWNQGARRLKGYSADEIMGKHFSVFYTPEDKARDHPTAELSRAIRDGRYEEEGWRVKKDGSRFWANVVITALWDKRGNLTGFAKVTRDLTLRKQQEEALMRKTEELEAFAHTISHDLRSPLRSIVSFAQILREDAKGLSQADTVHIDKILKSSQLMDSMITNVLKLSEISATQVSDEIVPLDAAVQDALALLEADIRLTRAEVRIDKPLPFVKGSRTLLLQILSNLVGNALKFTRPGTRPSVHVWAVSSQNDCEIHIRDEGVGIPAEFHKTIFNAFERGAQSGAGGMGIGLAVVKRAVERLGGTIDLKSQEGQGSEFIIKLHCVVPQMQMARSD